jgi:hypothetical protein
MFGIEAAKSFTDLQRTISNAIKRLLGRIEALEANTGSGGTDPQTATNTSDISALDTRLDTAEADITAIEAQLPPPITAITGLSDFIKVGTVVNDSDSTQSYSFDSAFVAGSDSDIKVILNRGAADSGTALWATSITKSGFEINRSNAIDGSDNVQYIAINGSYL